MADAEPKPACCPRCCSGRVAVVVYGLLDWSPELARAVEAGEVRAGGCIMICGESPRWACLECHHRWGVVGPIEAGPEPPTEAAGGEPPAAYHPVPKHAHRITLADLGLSAGLIGCLESDGMTTAGDVCIREAADLLCIRNFGPKRLREVREKLAAHGLRLWGE
jgi:RNA polymerase alpha subunit